MTIHLYNCSSAPHVVNKSRSLLITLSGDLKENTDMEDIVVTIPYFANFAKVNYAYIPEFGRYYFCHIEVMSGQRLKVKGTSDPLTSFWGDIRLSPCIAKRSSTAINNSIVDQKLPFSPQPKYVFRRCGTAFTPSTNGNCYVLTLGGR